MAKKAWHDNTCQICRCVGNKGSMRLVRVRYRDGTLHVYRYCCGRYQGNAYPHHIIAADIVARLEIVDARGDQRPLWAKRYDDNANKPAMTARKAAEIAERYDI